MIQLYVLEQCKHSRNAISLLEKLGTKFEVINIFEEHPKRLEMLRLTGSLDVPTIRNGDVYVQGYDSAKYEEFVQQQTSQ